ncbi:membrane protein insertase YidC [uncultured Dokdonia sp.]|uniref:membrane protein insertase YidC n=1 Tax=uncultured Dokdonia sp. TaxID=575653 RepID=UPI002630C6C9|nr:membrane protein insertase YidC [uncultured Dokdonia sp.]
MKKFDRTSVIGMLLMGLIIIYIMYTRPTPEEIEAREEAKKEQVQEAQTQETPAVATQEFTNTVAPTDSIGRSQLQNRLGAFAYSGTLPTARDGVTVVKNDVLELEVSNKGGHIVKATLLQHKTYDSIPVYLIKDGNSQFNISFNTTDNRNLNTKDLFFEPVLSKNGDNEVLTMRLKVSSTEFLEYRYELKQGDYMLDFGLKSQGLSRVFNTSQPMRLQWDFKGMRHAKSIKYENRYTRLTYEYEDGKTDKLSQMGEDDEIRKDLSWMNYRQHFFSSMLLTDTPFKEAKLTSTDLFKIAEDADQETEFTKEYKADLLLEPKNGELNYAMNMYYGPTDYKILKEYDRNLDEAMPLGWGIFGFLNKYLVIPFFGFLTGFLPAGIAIILMTISIKLLLSPVQYKQYVSQAKMKVLKPEIAAIGEKYKDNAMKKQQETMALYSKAGASPAAGCLPAFLQIPVFYALFTFFPSAFDLRGKSFLWAEDLSSYDAIFSWDFNIPIISSFYGNHISLFPILAAVTIFFSMRLTTGNQAMQQPTQEGMPDMGKMMKYMMYFSPLLMLFFFNNYASGLSLYYFISNLITIGIILVIKKYIIDEEKIKAKIEVKKAKPKKQGRFQKKMAEIMEQAEKQKNAKGK